MGICLILLGVFTFLRPRSMFTGIAVLYGIAAVVTGICDIVIYIKEERFTGFGPAISLVSGILSIMTGIALLAYPGIAERVVSLLFPLWFITHCISRLAHVEVIRLMSSRFYYYFSLAVNTIGLILGFLMLFQPFLALFTVGYLVAFLLIVFGIDCILMAFTDMGSRW